jgi:CubicO group peptidase (beta-lactamase class C family)
MFPIHYTRYIFWNFADVKDLWRFPYHVIKKGDDPFHFSTSPHQAPLHVPAGFKHHKGASLEEFLQRHKTTCFLVIQDDIIIYEKYFGGFAPEIIVPSFSVTKSFVSALTGIAIGEKKIRNTDQKVPDFLPWIKHNGHQHISIEHLLNMRSGIRFNESYSNPFGDAARFYYGIDLKKFTARLKIKEPPDLHYHYNSGNQQLLGFIVEAATGMKISRYLEEKLWKPLGMEHDATWNIDSAKHDNVKMFGCLNATPRDFAKFGRLYLNNGRWNGKQVVPEEWVRRSTRIINDSRDQDGYPFTYNWRVLEGEESFFAKGMLGQYIFVNRPKKLIMLRFGRQYGGIDWADFFNKLLKII